MEFREITEHCLAAKAEREEVVVDSVHYGELDAGQVELALTEPEVVLKAAGVEVPDESQIQVSVKARARSRTGRVRLRAVIIIIHWSDCHIDIIIIR